MGTSYSGPRADELDARLSSLSLHDVPASGPPAHFDIPLHRDTGVSSLFAPVTTTATVGGIASQSSVGSGFQQQQQQQQSSMLPG